MVNCCVPGCTNRSGDKNKYAFYRFPSNKLIRQRYIRAIRRENFTPTEHTRICSWHFPNGKKAGPVRFPWNEGKRINLPDDTRPHHSSPGNRRQDAAVEMEDAVLGPPVHSEAMLSAENELLKQHIKRLETAAAYQQQRFCYNQISHSEQLVTYYTSLSRAMFETLVTYVSMCDFTYHTFKVTTMTLEDQILLVLMKLRHNFGHTDLSVRFNKSVATVTNVFRTFVSIFAEALFKPIFGKGMPSREKNSQSMPASFRKFRHCRTTLDCTEIRIQRPDSCEGRSSTYSAYKAANTFKVMVGVAPNGTVNFVSDVYGGNASDKLIVETSGLLEQLTTGDLILADKGFPIKDIVPDGVTVNTPAYLFQPQFTKQEVMHNREVAEARVHVERAIQRLKYYTILDGIPHQYRNMIDNIVRVCAFLTTAQSPIISHEKLSNMSS
ncbi:uncharacterized protein LOC122393536 isoform X1 [Amphibalanus amphitrite]|uniref:uncharacterized protein LOC122393536 isoform X1 n=2 Tax=Amphibalanus amphitrite TaxID=1232801 RepID=UPI001C9280D5|nr:uncharacterized protein LOC122393536 isoform X1 [Amphibalanus amphitrite]